MMKCMGWGCSRISLNLSAFSTFFIAPTLGDDRTITLRKARYRMDEGGTFDGATIGNRFNRHHLRVSRIYENVNLECGPDHWDFRHWKPRFGDISRYSITESIGSGRYSEVFLGLQDCTNICAIKILKPVNSDRVRREFRTLSIVQGSPYVIGVLDFLVDPKNGIPCIVTEYVANISWRNLYISMTMDDIRVYIYRILQALSFTHQRGIMHRDIKPANILCDGLQRSVKLADWGLAEFYHPLKEYSIDVSTRSYKAPELVFHYHYYDYSVDLWSVGVILLGILSMNFNIFEPKANEPQEETIANVVGGETIISWLEKYQIKAKEELKAKLFTLHPRQLSSFFFTQRKGFADGCALDLASKLLIVDHKQRITADEALEHPFFEAVRNREN